MTALLIAVAAAGGALTRYGIGQAVGLRSFPWATLGINLSGSFVLGLLVALADERQWSAATTRPLTIGFLGAFTTFSTFSVETFDLLRHDRLPAAGAYLAASVGGGLLAAASGWWLGRTLA